MKIACIGGGPAGLYFAISMLLRDPSASVDIFERNKEGETFGWGVVFSDQTLENLQVNDPVSAQIIADEFAHWDDIDVHIGGHTETSSGHVSWEATGSLAAAGCAGCGASSTMTCALVPLMPNALTPKGRISAAMVLTRCTSASMANTGTKRTCAGIKSVATTAVNATPRPVKRSLASA